MTAIISRVPGSGMLAGSGTPAVGRWRPCVRGGDGSHDLIRDLDGR